MIGGSDYQFRCLRSKICQYQGGKMRETRHYEYGLLMQRYIHVSDGRYRLREPRE